MRVYLAGKWQDTPIILTSLCYWRWVGESCPAKVGGIKGDVVQCDKPMLSIASWQSNVILYFRGAWDFRGEGRKYRE